MTLTLANGVDGERLSPDQVVNMISGLGRDDLDVKVNMCSQFAYDIARGLKARGVKVWEHVLQKEEERKRSKAA